MTKIKLLMAAVVMSSFTFGILPAFAQAPEPHEREILHLLNFVISTDCDFERNGKKHSGEDAYKHIQRKYKHTKKYVSTTEEFIEYTASKSTVSGKEYLVFCGSDAPVTSRDWLMNELENYRQNSALNG